MTEVPEVASQEDSLSLHDELLWRSASEAYGKKEDGRGSGDKRAWDGKTKLFAGQGGKCAWNGKKVWEIADLAASGTTSLTLEKPLEGNCKDDAHQNTILKMLQEKNYEIDFHGYSRSKALQELDDIITTLKHNMKGKSKQQFTVITGKGHHSNHGIPVIQNAVLDYLSNRDGIKYNIQINNFGRIDITVEKKNIIV